ncbi:MULTISPECIES: hypothetical protein [Asaia]|uniref:hypothetical protein n=1 Tax=Asaia TaxID=91914 RepID=UPI002FC2D200
MSRNVYIRKFDPAAEEGTGSFPLSDVREALKAIGDPFFKEWGVDGENGDGGDGGIETGEQIPYTLPDGRIDFGTSTDTFLFTVKNGQVDSLDWDRPLGREGTIRALWHLIEIHRLSIAGKAVFMCSAATKTSDRISKADTQHMGRCEHEACKKRSIGYLRS